jgi:hypothetical protein
MYNGHAVDCRIFDGNRKKQTHDASIANLQLAYTKGDISPSAARKVKKIAEAYLTAITVRNIAAHRASQPKNRLPVFVTLTYPSTQIHDDQYLKRHHLTPFLRWLKETKKCAAYIWRSEVQGNGNIHFHIFTDKFLSWTDVRAVWNSITDKDGYVQKFYLSHGHTNPNSTDIKAVTDVEKASKYLTKYFVKNAKDKGTREQKGRVWGMSDNLRDLKIYHEDDFERDILINAIGEKVITREQINDFVSIYKFKDKTYKLLHTCNNKHNNLLKNYEEYYLNCWKSIDK